MHFLALAARGTLDVVAAECRALSFKILKVDGDGVHLDLSWRELAKALIHLRVAQRLLLELGHGNGDDGETLYYAARRIDWGEWLDARSTFAVYASGDTVAPGKRENGRPFSGLTDMRFVALRVKDAIADAVRGSLRVRRRSKRPWRRLASICQGGMAKRRCWTRCAAQARCCWRLRGKPLALPRVVRAPLPWSAGRSTTRR
jgi:23S rRNA G2445 N2-methylase RlmL